MQMKRALPLAVGMAVGFGGLPNGWAAETPLDVLLVSNATPNCGTSTNCTVQNVPKFSCPQGQEIVSVTVRLKNLSEQSILNASNPGQFACYTIEDIDHDNLSLGISGAPIPLSLAAGPNTAGFGPPPANCPANPPVPPNLYYYEIPNGGSVGPVNLLTTSNAGPTSATYTPADGAQFAYFTGAGTFPAQLQARADVEETRSGTFSGGIATNAQGVVEVTGECRFPPRPALVCDYKSLNPTSLGQNANGVVAAQFSITNTGEVDLTTIVITDTMEAKMALVAGSESANLGAAAGGPSPAPYTWGPKSLVQGASLVGTYNAQITGLNEGEQVCNTIQAHDTQTGTTTNLCNACVRREVPNVPVLGPLGLLTLLFGLPGIATLMRARRRRG